MASAHPLTHRVAASIATIGGLVVVAQGLRILLADGSYFDSEAAVVLSLDGLGAVETFQGKLLGGGQNFPRVYLLFIRAVRELLGDSTWATRLLPQLFFQAATLLWMRLLYRRFRDEPVVLLLGVLLLAAAPTWPIYSAAVKQYSFDTFWVLLLFSAPERWLDDALRRGERRGRLLWLVLPVAVSFTYGVALLARLLGWWVFGARREGLGVNVRTVGMVAFAFAMGSGLIWVSDLQHTVTQGTLFLFWKECTLSASPGDTLGILERSFLGFYQGPVEFLPIRAFALPVRAGLLVLIAGGVASVLRSVVARDGRAPTSWGSRSLGCAAGVAGVIATSYVLDYPLCAGRLLLYVLWFQQMLILEGAAAALAGARRLDERAGGVRVPSYAALAGAVLLAGVLAFRAFSAAGDLLDRIPVENLRPHRAKLDSAPELPIVVTECMHRQVRTLPEGLGDRQVVIRDWRGEQPPLPLGEEIWVVHSLRRPDICLGIHEWFRMLTSDAPPFSPPNPEKVLVYRTRVLTAEELSERAREARTQGPGDAPAGLRRWREAVEKERSAN